MVHASDREKWEKWNRMKNRKQKTPDNITNSLWYNGIRVRYCHIISAKNWVENIPGHSHRFLKNISNHKLEWKLYTACPLSCSLLLLVVVVDGGDGFFWLFVFVFGGFFVLFCFFLFADQIFPSSRWSCTLWLGWMSSGQVFWVLIITFVEIVLVLGH